ncbi:MAG: ferritin-like domain-containing protein [Sphingomonas sp.]
MHDQEMLSQALADAEQRRAERRQFLRSASVLGVAAGGSALLAACGGNNSSPTPTPTPTGTASPTPTPTGTATTSYSDADVLAFLLNLEYLEAQFFLNAAFGAGLDSKLTTGAQTAGTVTGGAKVTFADSTIAEYAREMAADERAHVTFLRTLLNTAAIAMPAINIDGSATGAFTTAARAAGLVGASATFNPYANDTNFLLGAMMIEDVVVSAYSGVIGYLSNAALMESFAGLQAAESYHAGLVRSTLYAMGATTPALITQAGKISNYRDSLDGTTDLDQGIATDNQGAANIVPSDPNGVILGRSPQQVLNILFLTAGTGVTKGGFFPAGVNGTIKSS